jgi:tetratricopeptide (TPR) repeat protein
MAGEAAGWLLDRASRYLLERGQYRQARPIAERALAVTETALGPANPQVASRCYTLGRVLQDLGDLASARGQFERALEISEATLDPDHPTVATHRGNLDRVLQALQEPSPKGPTSSL